ncbi:MAG: hypothetical protein DMD62_02685 [Gemmatimonadetes bacterium]|nr:MAG: hypothetical protein DMD62_02685 [Gemmatimonadota bacterium]
MLLGLLVLLQSANVDAPAKPPIIDTVIIDNHNIFEGNDASPDWLANLANGLHIRTRQWVIRRRLLLNRGDRFDLARMEESERALRNLGVFRSVRLDTLRQADDRLALRAVTADGWSTQPQVSFTSAGGDNTWALGLTERNFFGTATEVSLAYGQDPDRTHLDLEFINPHFFSRRTLVVVRYHNLSDGQLSEWRFGLPFHETAAPHSVETYGNVAQERVLRFRNGVLTDSAHHELFRVGLMGGFAVAATSHRYTRIWGDWEWRREDYTPMHATTIPYSVFTTVRAGFEVGSVRFRVLEHFNTYARREDVDLSPTLRAGIVLENGVGYEVSAQTSTVWNRGFAVLRLAANGLDTTRTQGQLTIVSQNLGRHTLIAHAEGGVVTNPLPGAEFDPWIYQRGPRLFGIHDFTGTRTTLFVLEDRVLVADNILGLMAFGLAPFVDYGGAWYADEAPRQGGNTGVSLRFGPTRAVRGDVAELAVGYRFGQGMDGKRWALTLRKGLAF